MGYIIHTYFVCLQAISGELVVTDGAARSIAL